MCQGKSLRQTLSGCSCNRENPAETAKYCSKHIAKYAMPYDIEFRSELPKKLVGKVAYRVLEEEELAKIKAAKNKENA